MDFLLLTAGLPRQQRDFLLPPLKPPFSREAATQKSKDIVSGKTCSRSSLTSGLSEACESGSSPPKKFRPRPSSIPPQVRHYDGIACGAPWCRINAKSAAIERQAPDHESDSDVDQRLDDSGLIDFGDSQHRNDASAPSARRTERVFTCPRLPSTSVPERIEQRF